MTVAYEEDLPWSGGVNGRSCGDVDIDPVMVVAHSEDGVDPPAELGDDLPFERPDEPSPLPVREADHGLPQGSRRPRDQDLLTGEDTRWIGDPICRRDPIDRYAVCIGDIGEGLALLNEVQDPVARDMQCLSRHDLPC